MHAHAHVLHVHAPVDERNHVSVWRSSRALSFSPHRAPRRRTRGARGGGPVSGRAARGRQGRHACALEAPPHAKLLFSAMVKTASTMGGGRLFGLKFSLSKLGGPDSGASPPSSPEPQAFPVRRRAASAASLTTPQRKLADVQRGRSADQSSSERLLAFRRALASGACVASPGACFSSSPSRASIHSPSRASTASLLTSPSRLSKAHDWNDSPGTPFLEPWALVKAAGLGDSEEISRLIDVCRQSPNTSRQPGLTALGAAVRHGRTDAVRTLLARGADPERLSWETEGAMTPLTIACKHGSLPCLELLLSARADASRPCRARALSPLGWAIEGAQVQQVQALVSARAPLGVGCTRGGLGPKALASTLMQRAIAALETFDAWADAKPATEKVIVRFEQIISLLQYAEAAEAEAAARKSASDAAAEMPAAAAGTVLFFP